MSRKRPSKVLDFLEEEEDALSQPEGGCWRGQGPAAVTEELVRQERMLRIELGRDLCGSYSEGGRSVLVGLGPRSGDVSGDVVMVLLVLVLVGSVMFWLRLWFVNCDGRNWCLAVFGI